MTADKDTLHYVWIFFSNRESELITNVNTCTFCYVENEMLS